MSPRTNSETPADHPATGWHAVPLQTLVEEGVLACVNFDFFWPYGLALTVVAERTGPGDREFDWSTARLRITEPDPPEMIVSGREDIMELLARGSEWLANRQAELERRESGG